MIWQGMIWSRDDLAGDDLKGMIWRGVIYHLASYKGFLCMKILYNFCFVFSLSGALVNAVFLIALCFSISVESFKRFYEPEDIHNPVNILIVGALGLLVNLLGLCLFHEHGGAHGHSHGGHGHGHSHGAHR